MSPRQTLKVPTIAVGKPWWIPRLNTALRFVYTDLALLNNGAWENLLDDLHWAIYGQKRNRDNKDSIFNRTATRESVREAQLGLLGQIKEQANDDQPGTATFDLARMKISITHDENGFYYWFTSEHLPSTLYVEFAHLCQMSGIKPEDVKSCSNVTCGRYFIPTRKPRKGMPAYCETRCAKLVATRNYRKRKAKERRKVKVKKRKPK